MKKTLKLFVALSVALTLTLCLFAFVGCDGGENGEGVNDSAAAIEITEKNPLPAIEPYKEFDMETAFVAIDGVEYSYEGEYSTDKEVTRAITFNGSKFTLNVDNAVFANVTITAKKGNKTATKEISLNVEGKVDAVDNGLIALWSEADVSKSACYNPEYIKDGDSSMKVNFSGYYNYAGTQFANLTGHLASVAGGIYDTEYFSIYQKADQSAAWEDAVITYWVYYASAPKGYEEDYLEVGYRFAHCTSRIPQGIPQSDFDFQDVKKCNLGEWTQVAVRLKDLYKTTPLYLDYERWATVGWGNNDELMRISDTFNIKCRLYDADFESRERKYIYTFYLDGFDIMTYDDFAEAYPEYDFGGSSSEEGVDFQGWQNVFSVANWKTSGKGIAFEFSYLDAAAAHPIDIFALFDDTGAEWKRLTNLIGINFDECFAEYGRLEALEGGKYRYELTFADAPLNTDDGEAATGNETASVMYFVDYKTHLLISSFEVITEYSIEEQAPAQQPIGVDYGAALDNKFSVANWKTSGKGIAFDFSYANASAEHPIDIFALFDISSGANWKRLTNLIGINFEEGFAEYGRVYDLGDGLYRYELMFADAPLNTGEGEEATGTETADLLYFIDYSTRLLISNFKTITAYSAQ